MHDTLSNGSLLLHDMWQALLLKFKNPMQENSRDYEFCIKVALDNAKRIKLLDSNDKNVLEEYKEWIKDGLSKHTVLSEKIQLSKDNLRTI